MKKYPRLTEIGSIRNKTMIRKEWDNYDTTPYGGFYTQEDIKEVVKYAEERCINIIPEVDLPGHMMAALAAYPDLGCTGECI
ncbi:family 20 glycosylhydrolase [Bacteroides salyersiae]|nr:family 20 glycosylhydrolase [Bacteroides salyersiae]